MSHPLSRLVWAIDPFSEDEALQNSTVKFLKALSQRGKTTVDPVSIVEGDLQAPALEKLTKFLKRTKLPKQSDVEVLVQSDKSLTKAVLRLVAYAKQIGANGIVVSTQANKGTTRFLLGSFAETLILESDVPTIAISPKAKIASRPKEIFFPTDFSERSKEMFSEVLKLALSVGAKVVVFHREETPLDAEGRAEPFVALAAAAKVPLQAVISGKGSSTARAILDVAKSRGSDLIAMVSHGAPAPARVVVGSTTRQVLRAAGAPVWIIHPR